MKQLLSVFLSVCFLLFGDAPFLVAAPVSPAPTVKPQWIYVQTNPLSSGGVTATYVGLSSFVSDAAGNAAIYADLFDANGYLFSSIILWISSKGVFLGSIDINNELDANGNLINLQNPNPTVLSVSGSALYTYGEGDAPYVRYTISKNKIIRTPFANTFTNNTTSEQGVVFLGGAGSTGGGRGGDAKNYLNTTPLSGVVTQGVSGTNNTFSFYHF
jgi:hypothetical protein